MVYIKPVCIIVYSRCFCCLRKILSMVINNHLTKKDISKRNQIFLYFFSICRSIKVNIIITIRCFKDNLGLLYIINRRMRNSITPERINIF